MTGCAPMTTAGELPRFVRDILSAPPRAGQGVNLYLFRLARVLHAYRTEREILDMLRASVAGCGRVVGEQEIHRAVENSRRVAWQPGAANGPARPASSTWPTPDPERRRAVLAQNDGFTLADLWESSPVRLADDEPQAEAVVDALFPGDPLLCCGQSSAVFATRRRSRWRGRLAGLAVMVPSPMTSRTGRTGRTRDGRVSQHTLENTGPRRHLIIEQDGGTPDEQAAILAHLGLFAPLALVVHSGRRSLHGWFRCGSDAEREARALMQYACVLGADRATWTRSQFVRIPDGLRDNGQRQYVFYLDPGATLHPDAALNPEAALKMDAGSDSDAALPPEASADERRHTDTHATLNAASPPEPNPAALRAGIPDRRRRQYTLYSTQPTTVPAQV